MSLAAHDVPRHGTRIYGSYVYLLLCPHGDSVLVKAGRSISPRLRLKSLITGCPFAPEMLATCELPGDVLAARAEKALHQAFRSWNTRGEWFSVPLEKKDEFNSRWRKALAPYGTRSFPIRWRKIPL